MPAATSASAIPFTSRGWTLQKSAICSNDSDVFSTSHTAVALGMSGACCTGNLLLLRADEHGQNRLALRPGRGPEHLVSRCEGRGVYRPGEGGLQTDWQAGGGVLTFGRASAAEGQPWRSTRSSR